jgi:hypothetical protein
MNGSMPSVTGATSPALPVKAFQLSVNRDGFYVHMQTVRSAFTAHRASTGQTIVRGLALSQATAEVEVRKHD